MEGENVNELHEIWYLVSYAKYCHYENFLDGVS